MLENGSNSLSLITSPSLTSTPSPGKPRVLVRARGCELTSGVRVGIGAG